MCLVNYAGLLRKTDRRKPAEKLEAQARLIAAFRPEDAAFARFTVDAADLAKHR